MEDVVIFVDESGDPNLDTAKNGTTELFTITAIIVPVGKLLKFEAEHMNLFGNGEAKSSQLRSLKRRIRRINKLSQLDFSYTSLIIHKPRIHSDSGFRYKKTFIKYQHRQMFDRFLRLYGNIRIIADEHGTHEFMEECKKYYKSKLKLPMEELISIPGRHSLSFEYVDSATCRGVQVADFLAGTQRRIAEEIHPPEILYCLKSKAFAIRHWPPTWRDIQFDEQDSDVDELIRELSLKAAWRYMDDNEHTDDDDTKICVETLRYLLDSYANNDRLYVYGDKIKGYLEKDLGFATIKEQKFRHIIAALREAKVPIASKSSGYKIPTCYADIEWFIRKVHNTVNPYLFRLGLVRNMLYEASLGKLDILDSDDLRAMQRYVDTPIE
jgi:hypothetical protein